MRLALDIDNIAAYATNFVYNYNYNPNKGVKRMYEKRRKLLTIKIAALIGITLVSLTLFSVILYLTIHIQIQSCINSSNCHQDQKQMPWVAPSLYRSYKVLELGGSNETLFIY